MGNALSLFALTSRLQSTKPSSFVCRNGYWTSSKTQRLRKPSYRHPLPTNTPLLSQGTPTYKTLEFLSVRSKVRLKCVTVYVMAQYRVFVSTSIEQCSSHSLSAYPSQCLQWPYFFDVVTNSTPPPPPPPPPPPCTHTRSALIFPGKNPD